MKFLNKTFFIKFFIVDFVFFAVFYITFITTFPIKEIVDSNKMSISQKTGKIIKYKDVTLGFGLSVNVKDLEIISIPEDIKTSKKKINKKKPTKPVGPIKLIIKNLSITPNISNMISTKRADVDFDADLMNGNIKGNFTVIEDSRKSVRTNKKIKKTKKTSKRKLEKNKISLVLSSINLMKLSKYLELQLPYGGNLTGDIDVIFATKRGKPVVSYLNLDLSMKKAKLGPGKVKAMGSFVTVDAIRLGNFKIKGKTPKKSAKFKFEPLKIDSPDFEASLNGTITFGRNIMPNLKLKFKFTDELLKTNRKIKAVMSGISNLKRKDGSYGVKLTGTFKHLRQRPWKR